MDKKQLIDTLMSAVDNALANTHTTTIARVTKVNETTIDCRPITNRVVDGKSIALPEFIEVPILTLQGGGSYTAYPIAVSDYCLLIFTERCFDRWYGGQDFQPPLELRMHDYSDGIALVGVNPLADAITIPSVIQTSGDSNHDGNHIHNGDLTVNGDLVVDGDITATGDIVAGTVSLKTHTHGGVTSGSSSTSVPTP